MIVLLALLLGAVAGWLFRGARAGDASTNAATSGWASRDTDAPRPDGAPAPGDPATAAADLPTQRGTDQTDGPVEPTGAPVAEVATVSEPVVAAEGAPQDETEAPATTVPAGEPAAVMEHAPTAVVDQAPPTAIDDEPGQAAPAVDTSDADAPVTPAPVTDAPDADAPVTPAPVTDAPDADAPVTPAPVTDAPAEADDDLRRIEGIGPKMATALSGAGIRTYRQLAGTDVETLRATVRAAGMRAPASLPTWPQQAAMFAGSAETVAAYPGPGPDEPGV